MDPAPSLALLSHSVPNPEKRLLALFVFTTVFLLLYFCVQQGKARQGKAVYYSRVLLAVETRERSWRERSTTLDYSIRFLFFYSGVHSNRMAIIYSSDSIINAARLCYSFTTI